VARTVPAEPDQPARDALVKALIEGEEIGVNQRSIRDIIADAKSRLSHSR
jgi:hypothetical protein